MRNILCTLLISCFFIQASGQEKQANILFTKAFKYNLYVEFKGSYANVTRLFYTMHKAGSGYVALTADSLIKQSDSSYTGKWFELRYANNQYIILNKQKKKEALLTPLQHPGSEQNYLNNGYFLRQYFDMSNAIDKQFPQSTHASYKGYWEFKKVTDKEAEHSLFRELADKMISHQRDSLIQMHTTYERVTAFLKTNMKTLDYNTVRDSLNLLPADYELAYHYHRMVVNQLVDEHPDYFLRLMEDFPEKVRELSYVPDSFKLTYKKLKLVEGYDKAKKDFKYERHPGYFSKK